MKKLLLNVKNLIVGNWKLVVLVVAGALLVKNCL